MPKPEISLLISTYERPSHLRRSLLSIALQKGVEGKIELVVTDDGSHDETPQIVEKFGRTVNFPVTFTTHRHQGFRLARCRNEGVANSVAPYLLFLDGDCVLPPDHVAVHLARRKPGVVVGGDCCCLDPETSTRVTETAIRSGEFLNWASRAELRRLATQHRKAQWYRILKHPRKPKLVGNNISIWRSDFERVNGFDEDFIGWGCEDDDLGMRLRQAKVQIASILRWTHTFHLWHPPAPSFPTTWRHGANVAYFLRDNRATTCENGLRKYSLRTKRRTPHAEGIAQ